MDSTAVFIKNMQPTTNEYERKTSLESMFTPVNGGSRPIITLKTNIECRCAKIEFNRPEAAQLAIDSFRSLISSAPWIRTDSGYHTKIERFDRFFSDRFLSDRLLHRQRDPREDGERVAIEALHSTVCQLDESVNRSQERTRRLAFELRSAEDETHDLMQQKYRAEQVLEQLCRQHNFEYQRRRNCTNDEDCYGSRFCNRRQYEVDADRYQYESYEFQHMRPYSNTKRERTEYYDGKHFADEYSNYDQPRRARGGDARNVRCDAVRGDARGAVRGDDARSDVHDNDDQSYYDAVQSEINQWSDSGEIEEENSHHRRR